MGRCLCAKSHSLTGPTLSLSSGLDVPDVQVPVKCTHRLHLSSLAPLKCVQGTCGCHRGSSALGWAASCGLKTSQKGHAQETTPTLIAERECPQHEKICENELLRVWTLKLSYSLSNSWTTSFLGCKSMCQMSFKPWGFVLTGLLHVYVV